MNINNSIFFALAEEQLAEGRRVKMSLRGTSMLPTLREEDVLTLEPMNDEPRVGDVLLFRHGGGHIVHRLVKREGDTCIMQGDNCYGTEAVTRRDIVARVVAVTRPDGRVVTTDSPEWQRTSRRSLCRKRLRNTVIRCFGRQGRRQLRPWYFAALAFLMWAPLNGIGIPLDNYIFGLRADHLLHASVFIPCTLFIMDVIGKRWLVWFAAVGIGLLTEGVQWLLPYRGYDVNDLIANALGVTLGWVVILVLKKRKNLRA